MKRKLRISLTTVLLVVVVFFVTEGTLLDMVKVFDEIYDRIGDTTEAAVISLILGTAVFALAITAILSWLADNDPAKYPRK